jgi:hypothetical protein
MLFFERALVPNKKNCLILDYKISQVKPRVIIKMRQISGIPENFIALSYTLPKILFKSRSYLCVLLINKPSRSAVNKLINN